MEMNKCYTDEFINKLLWINQDEEIRIKFSTDISEKQTVYSSSTNPCFFEYRNRPDSQKNGIRQESRKILRKLQGYISQIGRDEIVVCFIMDNNSEIEYSISSELLLNNGLKREGQPFEFIEEMVTDPNGCFINQRYVPICDADDFSVIPLNFPEETDRKYKKLLETLNNKKYHTLCMIDHITNKGDFHD